MDKLAPIALFTYKRLEKLKKAVTSLKNCDLSKNSHLYVISDGPKNKQEKLIVVKIRKYIKTIKGFKKISIILRKTNFGLSKNIIKGVDQIINKHEKIIVLEEDIVVEKNFLKFLNQSLEIYKNENKIWHISGWNYNLKLKSIFDAYFTKTMNCWGWGTWKNRWKYYEKKPKKIINTWTKEMIKEFNLDNNLNFFSQILRNNSKKINTWAIFWYAVIFENNKLCLNPVSTLSENQGIGKDSTHTKSVEKIYQSKINLQKKKKKISYPKKICEDKEILKQIKKKIKINNRLKFFKKFINF